MTEVHVTCRGKIINMYLIITHDTDWKQQFAYCPTKEDVTRVGPRTPGYHTAVGPITIKSQPSVEFNDGYLC